MATLPTSPDLGAPRIVSLLSAATEIVCRLGLAQHLVGRSHGCDQPALATLRPVCTAPYMDPNADSLAIDTAVRAVAEDGGPVYHIHNATVAELKPTVIIAQDQCRICAVTKEDVDAVCQNLPACTVVTIQPTTLDDVLGDVRTIARACGVEKRGERLVQHLQAGLANVRLRAAEAAAEAAVASSPKVCHVEWLAPLMGSGYWIHECVAAAGGEMVHGTLGGNSGTLPGVQSLSDAEVLILAPCGFSIERTAVELGKIGLCDDPEWKRLPAVVAGRVYVADGNLFYNRSSCGVLETAEMTAEMTWPELVGLWGHHGQRYVALDELGAFCARAGAPAAHKPVQVEDLSNRRAAAGPVRGAPNESTESGGGAKMGAGAVLAPAAAVARVPAGAGGGERSTAPAAPAVDPLARGAMSQADVVAAQLQALRCADFAGAFAHNSAANQKRFGSAASFETVVNSSASFRLLLDPECKTELTPVDGAVNSVKVAVGVMGQTACFIFDLVRADAGFFTDGVRIEC